MVTRAEPETELVELKAAAIVVQAEQRALTRAKTERVDSPAGGTVGGLGGSWITGWYGLRREFKNWTYFRN